MVKEDEAAKLNDAEEPANTSHLSVPSPGDAAPAGDQTAVVENALSSLPPAALKDLLSDGVCLRCILRFFSRYGTGNSLPYVVFVGGQMFSNLPGQNEELSKDRGSNGSQPCEGTLNEPDFCCICCGILQLRYIDGNRSLVKHESYNDFAASISKLVKQEGHEADCFTLEVSIPSFIVESEEEARLWMEKKYGSEAWFSKNLQHEVISIKDALKISITSSVINKEAVHDSFSNKEHNLTMIGGGLSMDSNNPQDVSESCTFLEGKVSPCSLEVHSYRLPIFIGGRYLKYSRNVSQTRWIIDEERKGEASVEEIVGDTILPICQGDNYKFHAAGREDIDVRMLGSGRPFLVELQNARVVPSMTLLKDMEEKINSSDNKLVRVKNLKVVDNEGWTLMREGEAEKQKEYVALVWISRALENEDMCTISSAKDMKIIQRTPIRVLHRRSPLDREKIIHWMKIEKMAGSSQYFVLHLCTQAGTYIKEFVHGDLGRTHPSIGSMLGCRAEILQLDVTDVKMDCF